MKQTTQKHCITLFFQMFCEQNDPGVNIFEEEAVFYRTCQKADGFLVLDADQVSVLSHTVIFCILPVLDCFSLKVIAVFTEEQIAFITV